MKLSLQGLVGYLQGKGWKVKLNEETESEEEVFELEEGLEEEDETTDNTMISEEEMQALKGFAQVLAKNGSITEAIQSGTLIEALKAFPAAAELVRNAQAQETEQKNSIIAAIKTNSSNTYTDEELAGMTVPVLTKLNAQMNVSYAGLGGGNAFQNASDQPLGIRPVLLAMPQKEEA